MPAPVKNAICGPQVAGTQKPDNMSTPGALASLNPCPLKGKLYPREAVLSQLAVEDADRFCSLL